MASRSEAELQDLLRLLVKRKTSVVAALGQAKSLRETGLVRYVARANCVRPSHLRQ
jgi:hypothetical protein